MLKSSKGMGVYGDLQPLPLRCRVFFKQADLSSPRGCISPPAGTLPVLLTAGLWSLLWGENLKGDYRSLRGKCNAPVPEAVI